MLVRLHKIVIYIDEYCQNKLLPASDVLVCDVMVRPLLADSREPVPV